MQNIMDFLQTAMPLVTIGLLLAIFFARKADKEKKEDSKEDYGTQGMCIGMCLGTAFARHTGFGICLGMLIGLVIGSCIEKKDSDAANPTKEV